MNKTISINLNKIVFNIDENAYQMLNEYLENIRQIFKNEDGVNEIIEDIECRICELLSEKITHSRQVVTIEDIEEIITRMGQPNEYQSETDNDNSQFSKATPPPFDNQDQTVKRRLFRNPNNKMLGGVCSGIATYINMDVTWVRLIFVVLALMTLSTMACAYIILWIIVPEALTAKDILEMNGESPTIENIGKTVKNSYDTMSTKAKSIIESVNEESFLKRCTNIFLKICSTIANAVMIIVSVIFIPIVIGCAMAILILLTMIIVYSFIPDWFGGIRLGHFIWAEWNTQAHILFLCAIGTLLTVSLPMFATSYMIFRNFKWVNPLPRPAKITLATLWIVGVIMMVACAAIIPTVI